MKRIAPIWFSNVISWTKLTFLLLILAITTVTVSCSDKPASDKTQSAAQDGKKKDAAKKDEKSKGEKDADAEKEKAAIPVEVVTVSRGDIQQTYRTITVLEAENEAQVVARSTGLMQKILVEEGDIVTKGQLLAQLDVEQLKLETAQIEATLHKLQNEMTRQQSLFSQKLGSSDALDRARYEHQAQQAQYELSKLKLRYASIQAPISGIIIERQVKQGNLIRDNDLLFKIVDLDSLIAVLHLPEGELANVRKGQKVLLNIDAAQGRLIAGEIDRIRPTIDTDTGTFRVVARIANQDHFLKSGMFGKVEVVFDVHLDAVLVQQQAIITQDNRSHVFVVKEDKAIQTPVSLGFKHNGWVEVVSGLVVDDQVITTGQQILKHEAKIEVVSDKTAAINEVDKSVAVVTTADPL